MRKILLCHGVRQCIFVLLVLFVITNSALAQVTVGTGEPAVEGSLLQIKNLENKQGTEANANKGLILPRVDLTDVEMLYPMFEPGYDKSVQDVAHAGLVVYNMNEDLQDGKGKGIYAWDEEKWVFIGGPGKTFELALSTGQLFLWENSPTGEVTLTAKKDGLAWEKSVEGDVGSSTFKSVTNGKVSTLSFTRSETVFGDEIYTFRLVDKPEVFTQLKVSNLNLVLSKPIIRVGSGSVDGAINSSSIVTAYGGGSANWEVFDYDRNAFNWTKEPKNVNGHLQFELGVAKATGVVRGNIQVRHLDQPEIVRTIVVEQNANYRLLPPFDYLVMEYGYVTPPSDGGKTDIDSATEFMNTNVAKIDGKVVGYFYLNELKVDNKTLLVYPGDDRVSGGENPYADIPNLNTVLQGYPESSTQFEFGMSARWTDYGNSTPLTAPTKITIKVYKGGQMVIDPKNDKRFVNMLDGKEQMPVLSFESDPKDVRVRQGSDPIISKAGYRKLYTPMYKLEYDLIDNTGVLIPWNSFDE